MSRRRDILLALREMVGGALPYSRLAGFDAEETPVRPERVDPGGNVLGYAGSPGEPEVDLSPLTYNYEHEFVLELSPPPHVNPSEALDDMLGVIGQAIVRDRTLGGLADWMEAGMPDTNDRAPEGAAGTIWARVPVFVTFSTTDPLN